MIRVNTEFYEVKKQAIEFTDLDRVIRGYISAVGGEDCDEVIEYDSRQEVFMQLSSLRKSTISWYPFKNGASVLEIEGGFGALTGALCDKNKRVVVTEPSFFRANALAKRYEKRENLEVYVGNIEDMEFAEQFDYIVLCGILEKAGKGSKANAAYAQYLRSLLKHLKANGKLLIAVDNLYSIQRWNDRKKQEETNQIYGKAIRYFHRKQLQDIIEEAGLEHQKFYYPMPDYRIVGSVYTEEYPPSEEEWQQLGGCHLAGLMPVQESTVTLKNLISNGVFSFWANSFFVEAGRTPEKTDIKQAMVLSRREDNLYREKKEEKENHKKALLLEQLKLQPVVVEIDQDKKQLKKVLEVQLDLLRQLKQVCDKHHLKLYMIYGTLLGAVRHGGVIPGDDDIDLALSREDFNKLLTLTDEFQGKYFLQTPWNDNYFCGGYLKLRNRETTAIQPQNWWVDCCEGIGIDIFPLDNGYQNVYLEKWKEIRICFFQRLLYAKVYGFFAKFMDMPLLKWKTFKYIGKLFSQEQIASKLHQVMAEGDKQKNSPFGIFAHYRPGKGYRKLSRKAFEKSVDLPYEDLMLAAPKGRYEVLETLYGANYMTPSPWKEGKWRHGFYRWNVPYQVYKKKFAELMKPEPIGKKIVLFGDGLLFEAYFQRYKDKFMPAHIVLLEEEYPIEQVHGIKTEKFEDFVPKDKGELYPVVCSVDIARAEEILQNAGYREYYIFVHNRDWLLLANPSWALKQLKGK